MRNPVGWFEIYCDDIERAKAFYQQVFGVQLQGLQDPTPDAGVPALEMWAFPMDPAGGGASGALVKAQGVSAGMGGTLVYFSCEDCAVEGARVDAAGGRIERGKMSIGPYGFIVLAWDTEGNMIGLHSMA